jgi:hypothetical protein
MVIKRRAFKRSSSEAFKRIEGSRRKLQKNLKTTTRILKIKSTASSRIDKSKIKNK